MKELFYCISALLLLSSCNSRDVNNVEETHIILQDFAQYDSLIFKVERMDTASLEDRIKIFETDKREIFYFDENWKLTNKEEAVFMSTIKFMEKDLFLIRDYYISGKNQMTGIYKALKPNVEWSNINEWNKDDADARKVGKTVYWYEDGRMSSVQTHTYTDFKKGEGETSRDDYEYPRKSIPVRPLKTIESD